MPQSGLEEGELGVDDFLALPPEDAHALELSAGRVVREPRPGPLHGHLTGRLHHLLHRWGEEPGLGVVLVEAAFVLSTRPATVRAPDVAFVRRERIPAEGLTPEPWEMAPDLAVEVVSPSDSLQGKALEHLEAGARLVWVVDPGARTVTVYRSRKDIRILAGDDPLEGDEVLPELRVSAAELFRG